MITINDIDVFILSYNRERYIQQTIDSLLKQTVGSFNIKILDNGSTDNTKSLIKNLTDSRIEFIGNDTNHGPLWNFERAQQLASKEYCMLFHDDDLLHPRYFEYVLKALNQFPNIAVISSGMRSTSNPSINEFRTYNYNPILFDEIASFAAIVYAGFPLNFASTVYKTEYLKKITIDFEKYGKISDRPMIFNTARYGNMILFPGQYVQYRTHSNQDSKNLKTGPFKNELIKLHKMYSFIIFNQPSFWPKIFFLMNFYKYLKEEYSRLNLKDIVFSDYVHLTQFECNISNKSLLWSKIFYYARLSIFYKIYRFLKRNLGEYS